MKIYKFLKKHGCMYANILKTNSSVIAVSSIIVETIFLVAIIDVRMLSSLFLTPTFACIVEKQG